MGLCLQALGVPFRQALQEARKLKVHGVELNATGDFSPQTLSQTGRRELRHWLRSYDLELTALGCPLRRGLDVAENQQQRLDLIRDVLSLSFDLGARLVVIQAGKIPQKDEDAPLLKDALTFLGPAWRPRGRHPRPGDRPGERRRPQRISREHRHRQPGRLL